MSDLTKDNATGQGGEVDIANTASRQHTKLARVIEALRDPAGINRFEAERLGDHCLNSTVAIIREMYGDKLIQRREIVPSRFTDKGVHVNRYWLTEAT